MTHSSPTRRSSDLLTDRTGDRVDRRLTGGTDLDERAVDADDGAEQADERRGRAHGGEERQTGRQLGVDRSLAAGQRAVHPLVLIDRIGQLAVLFGGDEAVVDDLAIGAVLLELSSAVLQARRAPEGAAGRFALIEDLLLLEHLREHDVPGHHRSEEHTSELQSLMRITNALLCL